VLYLLKESDIGLNIKLFDPEYDAKTANKVELKNITVNISSSKSVTMDIVLSGVSDIEKYKDEIYERIPGIAYKYKGNKLFYRQNQKEFKEDVKEMINKVLEDNNEKKRIKKVLITKLVKDDKRIDITKSSGQNQKKGYNLKNFKF